MNQPRVLFSRLYCSLADTDAPRVRHRHVTLQYCFYLRFCRKSLGLRRMRTQAVHWQSMRNTRLPRGQVPRGRVCFSAHRWGRPFRPSVWWGPRKDRHRQQGGLRQWQRSQLWEQGRRHRAQQKGQPKRRRRQRRQRNECH